MSATASGACSASVTATPADRPDFSIIIPTYNRPESLRACLESILQLDYPMDRIEVVVVDDGGRQQLSADLLDLGQRFQELGVSMRLLRQRNAGPAAARNHGAGLARGEFLAFTDDDCLVDRFWLKELKNTFAVKPQSLVGGGILNGLSANLFSCASQELHDYLYVSGAAGDMSLPFFGAANLAVSASGFRRVRGFDSRYMRSASEDREFCDRWLQSGGELTYSPSARIHHSHPMGPGEFWRQHLTYGRGARQFHRARSLRRAGPVRIEPARFYVRLLCFPLRHRLCLRTLMLSALLLLAQVAYVAGFLLETYGL